MFIMRNLIRRIIPKQPLYIQLIFTAFAFFLMVGLSHLFVTGIVQDNLIRNTESVLDFVEAQINADLTETRTILGSYAQTLTTMILNGEDAAKLQLYTYGMSDYLRTKENSGLTINGFYGYIEKLPEGAVSLNGLNAAPPHDYSPEERPWYRAALENGGKITATPAYRDVVTNELIMTYSCSLNDDKIGYLGVVCVDIRIDYIGEKAVQTALTKDGYGFIISEDMTLLAHPNPDYIGRNVSDPKIPLSVLIKDMVVKGGVSEAPLINWKKEKCICFIRMLPNGWYLGLLAPKNFYYQNVRNMALALILLGLTLATILIIVLISLDAARNKSDRESRHKSAFLANMSHEIRTPMNAIIGMITIGKTASNIERKDYCLMKIEEASNHLLGVINDILDMSKIEANKFELSPAEFDFEKMLQRAVNVVSFRVDEKKQKLSVHIDRSIPRTLIGDDQRLTQVITNLLGNAVKFTPEHGSIILAARLVREENGIYTLRISVSDTGIGINTEQQSKLFQSFEQAESSTTRKYGGTGLGLAISKSIVEMMGGAIGVQSEPGKGSTFTFTIQAQRGTEKRQGLLAEGISLSNVRILITDDDPEILTQFRDIVQEFGIYCDTAASGEEALALLEKNGTYHIYFVDWKMPGMDGIQLTYKLKERIPEKSIVIMISAAEWSTIAEDAKKAGVDKFLSKPLFPSTIAEIINECLGMDKGLAENAWTNITGMYAGRRILLVEDVEINREIVQTLLEPAQLEIDCAENGAEAVRMFSEAPDKYDMIFMDVQMPEMDGYEATRRIRALDIPAAKNIPIVAMTANVFREDIERCLDAGMNSHVGKPLDFKEVLEKLNTYLAK